MMLMSALGIGSAEDRYQLLLRISQIVNESIELSDVVDAIAEALTPLAVVDTLLLLTVENERITQRYLHVRGVERREGDTFRDIFERALRFNKVQGSIDDVPHPKPLAGTQLEYAARMGRPYVANGLTHENSQFDVEHKLCTFGIKAYVLCPLTVRGHLIGAIIFSRMVQDYFEEEEVKLFEDISRIVATALANALAYQKIRTLRDQLQVENTILRQQIKDATDDMEMVGSSPAIRRIVAAIDRVASTDSTVLICGETGTGKELVARAIHNRSQRAHNELIKVNCAAIPATLIASELFGHERGAFTGATQRRIGRFEMATGSSLFLDEVGEIPPDVQVSLLRVMQEREFERLGGSQTIKADVRMIAATNRDLGSAIADGSFRSDLYYRLNVFPIEVPPLRERREDIPRLVEFFLQHYSVRMGRKVRRVHPDTMALLVGYGWPGNIRELQNLVERGVILAEDGVFRIDPATLNAGSAPRAEVAGSLLRQKERETIETALERTRGRVSGRNGAAAFLNMPPSTLESRIRALGIDKHRFKSQMVAPGKSSAA